MPEIRNNNKIETPNSKILTPSTAVTDLRDTY